MEVVNRAALLFNTLQVLNLFFLLECLNYKLNGLKRRGERQETQKGPAGTENWEMVAVSFPVPAAGADWTALRSFTRNNRFQCASG